MPFFQTLADRASALGERDPITGNPINLDGPTKLEQTKGYIWKLVNTEMETGDFLNQMQRILRGRQDFPRTFHHNLKIVVCQIRLRKYEYEMAKQKYQPMLTLRTPPVPQQPAAATVVHGLQQYARQKQQQQQ